MNKDKDYIQLALIYGFIVPILIALLLISLARSNDDRVEEETRRSEMYRFIGDEKDI